MQLAILNASAMDRPSIPSQFSHYALLGVGKDATADDIEAAYRARVGALPKSRLGILLRWALMGETRDTLGAAREFLLDADLRAEYDKTISNQWSWLMTWM